MKILILGGTGMLGHKLLQVLQNKADLATIIRSGNNSFDKLEFKKKCRIFEGIDVRNFSQVESVLENFKPEFVINAVGVIKQSGDLKNELLTLDVNSIFPRKLAQTTDKYGFKLISISTDCVFNGQKGKYSENDLSDADDLYGKSKFLGEVAENNCLTIRTSIIGRELETRHGLIEWFLNNNDKTINGFKNAIFSGFPTITLSEIILEIIEKYPDLRGLYHISSNPISKYELLKLVKNEFNPDVEINPFEDFYLDRSLDSTRFRTLTGFQPDEWDVMIKKMADDSKTYIKWRN